MARERSDDPWRTREESALFLGAILWCVAHSRWLITGAGLDYAMFRELLRVRVLLALRPVGGASGWAAAGLVLAVLATWFVGLGTGLIALLGPDAGVWVLGSQSVLMLLLVLMLFQHLAGILVDPTDIGVVAAHPVRDRTLFAVRLTEVFAYVLVIVISFTTGNVFLAVLAKPPLAVLFVYPVLALLCGVTTLGLVALLFALCLRVVGPTHFRRVAMWAQILGGASIFCGAQVPRMVPREQWGLWVEELRELRFLWPPFQYAELYAFATGAAAHRGACLAAVLLPAVLLAITLWLASRYFLAGLQGTFSAPAPRVGWDRSLLARFTSGFGRRLEHREERAGFDFALALSRREPQLLAGVLPQLVMFQAMALGAGFGLERDVRIFIPLSAAFLFMVLPNVLLQSQGTPVPEAREMFVVAPLESEEALLRGGVKALLLQWILLPALVLVVVQLVAAGPGALPRIVLAFELSFTAVLIFTRLFQLGVPFTQPARFGSTGAANMGILLVMGLMIGIVVGIHFVLALHPLALAAGIVGLVPILVWLWRRLSSLRIAKDRRL